MVGKNLLKLNQATMRDALQEYLEERYEVGADEELVVEKVERAVANGGYSQDCDFDITVSVAKKQPS